LPENNKRAVVIAPIEVNDTLSIDFVKGFNPALLGQQHCPLHLGLFVSCERHHHRSLFVHDQLTVIFLVIFHFELV
jgi:hypothetical protein